MNLWERLHFLHRAWRYRLRSERDEIRFLLSRHLQGGTAVDIGANRGIYSYWMHRQVGAGGRVVAFEPQPELGVSLEQLKLAFHLKNLQVANVGLSSAPARRTMVRPIRHWGGGSLELIPRSDTESFEIQVTTLDDYFAGGSVPRVQFIKCDVEAHEAHVVRGGQRLLRRDRPELLIESLDRNLKSGELVTLLTDLDYQGYFFHQGLLAPLERYTELRYSIPRQYLNYVFLPKENTAKFRQAA